MTTQTQTTPTKAERIQAALQTLAKTASGYIYIASAYSTPSARVRSNRYTHACAVAWHLSLQGLPVYSPIAHGHSISGWAEFDQEHPANSHAAWMQRCAPMLRGAACLYLAAPSTKDDHYANDRSIGVQAELAYAKAVHMPIVRGGPWSESTNDGTLSTITLPTMLANECTELRAALTAIYA
jgi:hypothetical protein